ncbi:PREDICTED: MLP-like protein 423 [Fragaria vesca subsp. vesca]|uniref:MLP-like protein 423 n=1 Tax=Fragaria vesca subsp. vesca TaxID=101020 RepID=UPI0002C32F62|nr:PREDICTED: MLP-like protein 423 [Fragaria vesca subsp. vesca]
MAPSDVGKLHVEVEVKSPADKFWVSIRDSTEVFPKAFPHDYKSIDVLEGDGKAVGSVRLITYSEGSPIVKVSKETIDMVDETNKAVAYQVIDGDLLKYYKSFKCILTVIPKGAEGEGSLVKWSCEYEKAHEQVPEPSIIKDFAVKNFKELDDYVLAH